LVVVLFFKNLFKAFVFAQTPTVFVEHAKKHARSPLALPKTPKICLRRLGVSSWWFGKAFLTFLGPLAWAWARFGPSIFWVTEKKISFFWVGRGSARAWAGKQLLINVLQSKGTLAEAFAHT
jgi:hypothetical protein